MSRSEHFTAIAVGIGMYFLFYHFHLIPSSYAMGRLAATAAVALGFALVIIIWSLIVKKKNDQGGPS